MINSWFSRALPFHGLGIVLLLSPAISFGETIDALPPLNHNQNSVINYIALTGGDSDIQTALEIAVTPEQFYVFLDQFSAASLANQQVALTRAGQKFENQLAYQIDRTQVCQYDEISGIFAAKDTELLLCDYKMAWLVGYGGQNTILNTDISSLQTTNFGGSAGVQWILYKNIIVGVAGSYTKMNDFVEGNELGKARGSLYQLGVYGWNDINKLRVGFSFDYGRTDTISDIRGIDLGYGISDIFSEYYLTQLAGQLRASYRLDQYYHLALQPTAALLLQHVNSTSFYEFSPDDFALYFHFDSYSSIKSQLGLRGDFTYFSSITPQIFIAWEYDFARPFGVFQANLVDLGIQNQFTIYGTGLGRNSLTLEAGFRLIDNKRWQMSVLYEGHFADELVENSGKLELGFF